MTQEKIKIGLKVPYKVTKVNNANITKNVKYKYSNNYKVQTMLPNTEK